MMSPRSGGVAQVPSFVFGLVEIVELGEKLMFAIFTIHISCAKDIGKLIFTLTQYIRNG